MNSYDSTGVTGTGSTASLTTASASVVVLNKYSVLGGNWTDPVVKSLQCNADLTGISNSISLPNITQLTIHNNVG